MTSVFRKSLLAVLLSSILALVLAAILLVSAAAIYLLPPAALDTPVIAVFFGLAVFTLAAVAVDVYILVRYITDPLRRLAQATRAIAQGDLGVPLTVRREDEIGSLADDFRAMQRELQAARLALESEKTRYADLNELKERLLANVPHEIKTPLSAIAASLEILQEDGARLTEGERAQLLESIHRSVARLEYLVENMLDAASIQAGQFRVRLEGARLGPMLAETRLFLQPLLDQKGQTLSLVDLAGGALVMADPLRITQVLTNLVSNASKHGPAGSTIGVEVSLVENCARVRVHNAGAPIPPDVQRRLFERFTRNAGADGAAGAGLGLAIARTIIEMHHGQIGLTSTSDEGTTAWFAIPLAPEAADATDDDPDRGR